MKKVFVYTILLLSILSFHACLQDSEDVSFAESAPVFFLDASFNGEPKIIEAGIDEFFMYTSFAKDNFDVYTFIGKFGKLGSCVNDCTEDFTFFIRDSKASPEESLPIQSAGELQIGNYDFLDDSIPPATFAYEVSVTDHSVYSGELVNSDWNFPDLEDTYTTSAWSDTISNLGVEASLTIQTEAGCTSVYTTTLTNNSDENCFYPIDFSIDSSASIPGAYKLTPVPLTGSPADLIYSWAPSNFEPGLLFEDDGTHCVTITDPAGCSHERCVTLSNVAGGLHEISYCSAGFSYEVSEVALPPTVQDFDFTNIILNYTDSNDVLFSSAFQPQPASSYFEVLSVNEFDFNEQNYPTLQLQVRFDCVLFNAQGEGLLVRDATASVGVAYPAGN